MLTWSTQVGRLCSSSFAYPHRDASLTLQSKFNCRIIHEYIELSRHILSWQSQYVTEDTWVVAIPTQKLLLKASKNGNDVIRDHIQTQIWKNCRQTFTPLQKIIARFFIAKRSTHRYLLVFTASTGIFCNDFWHCEKKMKK